MSSTREEYEVILAKRDARIAELEAENTELRRQSRTDARTGCWNQRAWDEVRPHAEAMDSIAVILIDVDRFKTVNDELGYQYGDFTASLVGTALRLAAVKVVGSDTVCRIGGDEFVILAPNEEQIFERIVVEASAIFYGQLIGNKSIQMSFGFGATKSLAELYLTVQKRLARKLEDKLVERQLDLNGGVPGA